MSVTRTVSITDTNHKVTYSDADGVVRTMDRSIETRVFAPDAPGTYKVILYSHGMGGSGFNHAANTASALADQGYIVIAPTHLDSFRTPAAIQDDFYGVIDTTALHRVADMQFLLTQATSLVAGLIGYTVDLSDTTIAGHSMGAFTTHLLTGGTSTLPAIAGLAAENPYGLTTLADDRFKQAILLSPQGESSLFGLNSSSWDQQGVPTMTLTGTLDSGLDNQTYVDRLDGFSLGPSKVEHAFVISGADHSQLGGNSANPAISAEVNALNALFLQTYVQNQSTALSMASPESLSAFAATQSLLSELYTQNEPLKPASPGIGVIKGSAGNDTLRGLDTADVISGGAGEDTMQGGAGSDRYAYTSAGNHGQDTILDFQSSAHGPRAHTGGSARFRDTAMRDALAQDLIDLTGMGYSSASLNQAITVTTAGADTLIGFSSGNLGGTSIRLIGIDVSQVTQTDFLF
ncbi:MAG: hypothetical protein ACRCWF_17645 [Beijerinckiaceae bacterium]